MKLLPFERPSLEVRRVLPRGFFGRALVIVAVPLVLLQLLLAAIFYEEHWEEVGRQLAYQFANQLNSISKQIANAPDQADAVISQSQEAFNIRLHYEPGETLDAGRLHPADSYLDYALERMLGRRLDYSYRYDTRSHDDTVEVQVELPSGVLTVVAPIEHVSSSTTNIFISLMIMSSVLAFVLAVYFLRQQVLPLRAVARAAERFGRGDTHAPLVVRGATEVRRVAQEFLTMRDRIQAQIEQRTEFLAGVSHDLRTLVTRLRLQLELLGDTDDRNSMKADLDEMEFMIESYLAFAQGEGEEAPDNIDLGELLRNVVVRLDDGSGRIELSRCEPVRARVRAGAVRRAITNLVENALRQGHRLEVSLTQQRDGAHVVIDDDGPGIRAEQREEAFKPFRQLDNGGMSGGTGLGLTIARDIARSHGGEIELADSPAGGLRALFRIPL